MVDKSPVLNDKLWDLITWLADYYNTPLGVAAKAALPANLSTEYEPRSQLYVKGKIGGEPLADRAKSQIAVLNHLSTIDEFIPAGTLGEIVPNALDVCRKLGVPATTLFGAWQTNLKVSPEKDWEELKGRAVVEEKSNGTKK